MKYLLRICSTAVLVSLLPIFGIALFYAKDIDALNAAARETDLRPRVRGQRPLFMYDQSGNGRHLILPNAPNITDLLLRIERLERRLDEEQARRQIVPVPMPQWIPPTLPPLPWVFTNGHWQITTPLTNGIIKTDVKATDAETARAWELVRRTGEALLRMQQEQAASGRGR